MGRGGGVGAVVLGWALVACGGAPSEAWEDEACAAVRSGDVVISEYLNDPEGTDTGREYVELHNPTHAAVELEGLLLYAARADGSQEKGFLFLEPLSMAPRDYLVLGDVRDGALPAHVDLSYGSALGALGNTSGAVGLRCGDRVIDEVPLAAPGRSGVARGYDGRLVPDSAGNDDLSRWCDAPDAGSTGAFRGSPGEPNAPCGTTVPSSPGGQDGGVDAGVDAGVVETCLPAGERTPRAVRRPRPGALVLTEVMANPLGDDTLGEWVEVLALEAMDLNGLTLATDSSSGTTLKREQCLSIPAGGHALLARKLDAVLNGGLPAPLATFGMDLRNAGGVVSVRAGEEVLDAVTYGPAVEGVATQVAPERATSSANDAPEAWCRASLGYGTRGNLGTPGLPNTACSAGSADAGSAPDGGMDAGTRDGGADAGGVDAGPDTSCVDRVTGKPRARRVPDVGSVALTEWMADPSAVADVVGEWVEVLALRDVDLNGVALSNESGARSVLESPLCLTVRAGARAVLARSADTALNGGLPSVLGTFSFILPNDAGPHVLRLSVEGRELDALGWSTAAKAGQSWQVAPAYSDPVRNDVPGSACLTPLAVRYGLGDRGTPGLENRPCSP
ncbi:lamin tail domain-containing protein [Myxococcus sp. K15C18031901]|uniref:lamin tail domain-containing protein n=1 Tax=Myxococcus dinghuensis TaxID=2906761 RepID=UPI0020A70CD4|nr:lamin tail domain-containing protein [Myxococcus dinghuensis]MCP3098235.1 lamin tail domain-containing protein [Myxococcus dinghuensis]